MLPAAAGLTRCRPQPCHDISHAPRERGGVHRRLAVENTRLVEQQTRRVGGGVDAGVPHRRGQRQDQGVARIDFENTAGRLIELSRVAQHAGEVAVEVAVAGYQAHGAVGEAAGGAHVGHIFAQALLKCRDEDGDAAGLIVLRFRLVAAGRELVAGAGHRCERLALERADRGHPRTRRRGR